MCILVCECIIQSWEKAAQRGVFLLFVNNHKLCNFHYGSTLQSFEVLCKNSGAYTAVEFRSCGTL